MPLLSTENGILPGCGTDFLESCIRNVDRLQVKEICGFSAKEIRASLA